MDVFCEKVSDLEKLSGEELRKRILKYNPNASESEMHSWCVSLPRLIKVICDAGLGRLYLAAEYVLPAGGRIDAVILGDSGTGQQTALVVELKQWSASGVEYCDAKGAPAIKVSRSYYSRHPVTQSEGYRNDLQRNHSNAVTGELRVSVCQYLHEFEKEKKDFFVQAAYASIDISHLYCRGEEAAFQAFLQEMFAPAGDSSLARDLFVNGEYIMTEMDMEIINQISSDPQNIPLLHDQSNILDYVIKLLADQSEGRQKYRHMVLISGAAGTGKTIVGFRILAEYCKLHGAALGGYDCVYTFPRSRTIKQVLDGLSTDGSGIKPVFLDRIADRSYDLIVIDEAHRVTERDLSDKKLKKAKMLVVLQDDRQRVLGNEVGVIERYKRFAKENRFMYWSFSLVYQKRAGLGSFVERLDRLLYGDTYQKDHGLGIGVEVYDSLQKFEEKIEDCHTRSESVKYYAPYCWKWKSKKDHSKDDIIISDGTYTFIKKWNPFDDQYKWYMDSISQVGCVYTAQGLGFDYVGVIWWEDLLWRTDHWEYNMEKITGFDSYLANSVNGSPEDFHYLILNIYRVLLTRAKKGLYVWIRDEETREYFKRVIL